MTSVDVASLIARLALGSFFVLARFRFFYDPSQPAGTRWLCSPRRRSLTRKMCVCGWKWKPSLWAWIAALIEVGAGAFLIIGLLTRLSAFGLLAVTVVANVCTAREKVLKQNPVDRIDCIGCYLWTAEPLYIMFSLIVLLLGPGLLALDSII
jgi:uncharacterized membrane protein YphA (DoxX/SURF4 family)